MNSVNHVILN